MLGMADAAKRRWFHPTPDRLVRVLLALEGFLWLSERFRWFAFNQHKGYAVLVAVAAVAAFLLLMVGWCVLALLFRLRFQFSIRSLLVLTLAVAVPCSWLATEVKAARKQREAAERIEAAGGVIGYNDQFDSSRELTPGAKPPGPAWLRSLLGDVTSVGLYGPEINDAVTEHLEGLPQLEILCIGGAEVGDAGLEHLQGTTPPSDASGQRP